MSGCNAAAGTGRAVLERGMAKAVIGRALLGIGEHRIGLVAGLEPRLGFVVARIAVGVILHRHPAVGLFDLLVVSAFADSENFVVIAF